MSSTFTARAVSCAVAGVVGVTAAAFLQTQRWASIASGGVPLAVLGVASALLLAAALGPRLARRGHGVDAAVLMALAVVPLTALFVGMLGMAEVVVGGLDVHVLAPMGLAFLGLLVIGPAGLVVAVPAAVAWSQLTRLALRRVAARPSAPVLDP